MQPPPTVLSQITRALYPSEFARCAETFRTQRPTRSLTVYSVENPSLRSSVSGTFEKNPTLRSTKPPEGGSRIANQNPRKEDQRAAEGDLQDGGEQRRVHES